MQTRAHCIHIKDPSITIENGAFSADGQKYALSFSDCSVKIYHLDKQEEIASLSFSSPLTIINFKQIHDDDFLIAVDIDRYVSIHRISDKSIIRKNELPFEALQMTELNIGETNFFLFSGISNKISIFTDNLMFLDNIQCNENWIWDFQIDNCKNLFLCGRSGVIEMRSLSIPSFSTSNSNFIIYIENLNRFCLKNTLNDKNSFSLSFPKIICSLSISSHHLLVMFKSRIYVYLYNYQDKIETKNDLYQKMFEIPGNFDDAKSDISDRNIFVGLNNQLTVYSMNGILKTNFKFNSKINFVIKTEAINDGCIVSCDNGSIFFFIVNHPEPVLLFKHKKAVKFAKKWNLLIAFIDIDKNLFVIDTFTNEVLLYEENIESFVFSDRVDNLFAYNNENGNLFTHFLCHKSKPSYIEGKLISFFGNKVALINGNSIEYCFPELPFKDILYESKHHPEYINKFYELVNVNPNIEQWKLIYRTALEINNSDIATLAAQHCGENFNFFQCSQKVETGQISIEKYKKPNEFEELGAIDFAIRGYAYINDWENVYRLVEKYGCERLLLDLNVPENQFDNAAKYLLNSDLYDGAIQILKKSKNISALANAYVFMGNWLDAITLSISNPSIYHIIFPRFGEKLFEHKNYFESIVCFFVPTLSFGTEERTTLFSKLYYNSSNSNDSYIQKSFISLLQGFNEPINYWLLHLKSIAYYASNRLSEFLLLPMNEDDAITVFHLSYFVIAFIHRFQIGGIHYYDILTQFLLSSAILGLKKWMNFAIKELSSFPSTEPLKQLIFEAQNQIREKNDQKSSQKVSFICPKCKNDIFDISQVPLLICGSCGSSIAFSSHSCSPISICEVEIDSKNEKKGVFNGHLAIEFLSRKNKFVDDIDMNFNELVSKELLTFDDLSKLPLTHCVFQKLKKESGVRPRLWISEKIEEVHSCCNCGAFYNETDYEDAVIGHGRCVICHSPIVDESEVESEVVLFEEESSILNLLRPFEEDSPVKF